MWKLLWTVSYQNFYIVNLSWRNFSPSAWSCVTVFSFCIIHLFMIHILDAKADIGLILLGILGVCPFMVTLLQKQPFTGIGFSCCFRG